MAKIAPEYIHEYLGKKFQDVYISMHDDQCIMSLKPTMRHKNSPLQKQSLRRFKAASDLAIELRPLYRDNYMPLANKLANHNTPRSLFMRHLLNDVISINPENGDIIVAYEKIKLTPE